MEMFLSQTIGSAILQVASGVERASLWAAVLLMLAWALAAGIRRRVL